MMTTLSRAELLRRLLGKLLKIYNLTSARTFIFEEPKKLDFWETNWRFVDSRAGFSTSQFCTSFEFDF